MRFVKGLSGALAMIAVSMTLSMGFAASAHAQATRTWISGVGDDANPCSRTAPCKTFAGAISKTAAGGEIDCLDPGGFGALTITKAITLDCGEGMSGAAGGILASGTNGININAGASDRVVIRNLVINGGPLTGQGLSGIRFLAGGSLTVEHVVILGFGASSGSGVEYIPSATSPTSKLLMRDVEIQNNTAAGINIAPTGGALVSAVLENVFVTNNGTNGLFASDGAYVSVRNSRFAANGTKGVFAKSTTGAVQINLDGVLLANNTGQGVSALGAAATVRLSDTGVYGNAFGVQSVSSGVVFSFGDNRIGGNNIDGAPTQTGSRQ